MKVDKTWILLCWMFVLGVFVADKNINGGVLKLPQESDGLAVQK